MDYATRLQLFGALFIFAGVALVSIPASLIVVGVLAVVFGIAQERGAEKDSD